MYSISRYGAGVIGLVCLIYAFPVESQTIQCHLPSGEVVNVSKNVCGNRWGLVLPSNSTFKSADTVKKPAPKLSSTDSVEQRLRKLKSLLDQGLITLEDAAEKRKEILLDF